jgi:putative hydrolase of the HAD superfamily
MLLMRTWVCSAGLPEPAAEDATRALRAAHDARNFWRRVPDHVRPALARARASGHGLAVVSNSEGGLHRLLDELALGSFFDVVVDSAREGVCKPDPEIFLRACRRLGVAPESALYAGDLPEIDVAGARAAGLDAALVDALGVHRDYADAPRFSSIEALVEAIVSA